MNFSRLFIERPVATTLLMVALLLAGGVAVRLLPISALPQVDYPTMQVTTLYPGAGPDVMVSSITAPLERQFGQIPGLTQMYSTSAGGASVITLRFNLDLNLDVAEQQVQAAINAAANLLPRDLPAPPVYNKVNPADAPILTLALTSSALPLTEVQDLADTRIVPRISQLTGVGLVTVSGGMRPAVRIRVNPSALAEAGLSTEDLRSAIAAGNVNQPKGSFDNATRSSTLDANDQLLSIDDYRNLVVAWVNGASVRVADVADVVEGAENDRLAAWRNDQPAVILNVQRQPGANVIAVADRIKELLPTLRTGLPAAVEFVPLTDRTTTIRASVKAVVHELMLAVVLVVAVIFVFLRSWRATLIPAVAVPLSLVGTFAFMQLWDFSLNNLTLMALTIAAGFVVDDAIVMIENIARHIENGDPPLKAALKGAKQIEFTIISLTVSLIAVLIPLLFMREVVGRLFREFAVTLAISILISAIVSLTLTPMMCARLLRSHAEEAAARGGIARWSEAFFNGMIAVYDRALCSVLRHRFLTMAVFLGTVALTAWLGMTIGKGFFPQQDTGIIQGVTVGPQSVSFAALAVSQQALGGAISRDPDVESVSSFIGIDGVNSAPNIGRMLINLKPVEERRASAAEIAARLREGAAGQPGMRLYLQPVQDLTIEDRVSRTQFQFTLQSPEMDALREWTEKLTARLQTLPILEDVTDDLGNEGLQARVVLDRDTAGRLGITAATLDAALYNAFGQRLISTIFTQSGHYRVVLEHAPEFRDGLAAFDQVYLPGTDGVQVPLSAVSRIVEEPGPLTIAHQAQFPCVTVSFNLAPGVSLGEAVRAVEAAERDLKMPLSIETRFEGATREFQSALGSELWLILAAVLVMYLVLGVLYESFIHPVTILSTLPSAGVGALLALQLKGMDLTVMGIIGIVLLIGIVKKNAILVVDFALDAQRAGQPALEAIQQACLLRFRPILMTTMAALLSALPLVIGSGEETELRQPLGVTMVGGLLVSQLLTLFTTPVIYLMFESLKHKARPKSKSNLTSEPRASA